MPITPTSQMGSYATTGKVDPALSIYFRDVIRLKDGEKDFVEEYKQKQIRILTQVGALVAKEAKRVMHRPGQKPKKPGESKPRKKQSALGKAVKGLFKGKEKRSHKRKKLMKPTGIVSPPGMPPHVQTGRGKDSLSFMVNKQKMTVSIGYTTGAPHMAIHEFGITGEKGRKYPQRPAILYVVPKLQDKIQALLRSVK